MSTKKLIPLFIALLGLALVIAAIVVWLEPPKDGGVFNLFERESPQPAPQPDLQEALSLSRCAVEIFTHLRSPYLQSAQETLAEIESKIKEQ